MSTNEISFYDFDKVEIIHGKCCHKFPLHIHESFCVGKIICGKVKFIIGNVPSVLSKGQFYCIPSYTPHSMEVIDNKLYEYKTICFKKHKNKRVSNCYKKSIRLSVQFIKNNYDSPFDLQELADYVNVSKFHLIREFKKTIGLSPNQYYISEKIRNIRQSILNEKSLSDIVFNLGFSDQSHFCNTFKKHVGITPLEFKYSYNVFNVLK